MVLFVSTLAWSLLVLITYSFLRGYYGTHILAVVILVRLAVGLTIGVCAGIVVLIAQLLRVPGSQFSLLKVIVYVSATTVTGLAAYNFFEL